MKYDDNNFQGSDPILVTIERFNCVDMYKSSPKDLLHIQEYLLEMTGNHNQFNNATVTLCGLPRDIKCYYLFERNFTAKKINQKK